MIRTSHSEEDTAAVGRELAQNLAADAVVLLSGDLGAGKTAFVRGLAEGLGVDPGEVSSPDLHADPGVSRRAPALFHVDLYRLTPKEVDDLGLDDLTWAGGVVAVEWPDRWHRAPPDAVRVTLTASGDTERTIEIAAPL